MSNARELLNKVRKAVQSVIARRAPDPLEAVAKSLDTLRDLEEGARQINKLSVLDWSYETTSDFKLGINEVVARLSAVTSGFASNGQDLIISTKGVEAAKSVEAAFGFIVETLPTLAEQENLAAQLAGLREVQAVTEKTEVADGAEVSDEVASQVATALESFAEKVDKADNKPISWPRDLSPKSPRPRRR